MSTPGRARALRSLGAARRANVNRVARGEKPMLGGKRVSLATFNRRTGAGLNKATAKARKAARR